MRLTTGENISTEAFAAFDKWCRLYGPKDCDAIVTLASEYGKWCDAGNRVGLTADDIERYRLTGSTEERRST